MIRRLCETSVTVSERRDWYGYWHADCAACGWTCARKQKPALLAKVRDHERHGPKRRQ